MKAIKLQTSTSLPTLAHCFMIKNHKQLPISTVACLLLVITDGEQVYGGFELCGNDSKGNFTNGLKWKRNDNKF